MVHLTRLGYKYFGKIHEATEGTAYDGDTNILLEVFKRKFEELNPGQEGECANARNSNEIQNE